MPYTPPLNLQKMEGHPLLAWGSDPEPTPILATPDAGRIPLDGPSLLQGRGTKLQKDWLGSLERRYSTQHTAQGTSTGLARPDTGHRPQKGLTLPTGVREPGTLHDAIKFRLLPSYNSL